MTTGDIWYFRCLGGLRAVRGGQTIDRFRTQKTASLLAFLAMRPGAHRRELLTTLLWPEMDADAGRNNLSTSLSSLRRQLESELPANSILVADRLSVGLNPQAIDTDVRRFEAALSDANRASGNSTRAQHLIDALDLYEGPFLLGFYEEWVQVEARRCEEQFNDALRLLLSLLEETGQFERAIEFAGRGVATMPAAETWYVELMRLYAVSGQFDAALRQFKDLQKAFRRSGEEPSEEAHQLLAQIRRQSRRARLSSPDKNRHLTPSSIASGALVGDSASIVVVGRGDSGRVASFLLMDRPADETERLLFSHLVQQHGGALAPSADDVFLCSYARVGDAAKSGVAIQAEMRKRISPVLPRMTLGTGEIEENGNRFRGEVLERTSRLLRAAHGGQILCDEVSAELLRANTGSAHSSVTSLGRYRLGEGRVQQLFQVGPEANSPEVSLLGAPFPPPRAVPAITGCLPTTFTRFFGRRKEIEAVRTSLQQQRLLTLSGIGGCGKTRLAIESAREFFEEWQGAVWFVPLADIREPGLIPVAIRDAMRLPVAPGSTPQQQIREVLSSQASLLILDNFEQLVEEGAACVAELLETIHNLKIIVTSRHTLNIAGECEIAVVPLPVPDEEASLTELKEFSSTALFIDRARAVRADFALSERNARATGALCRRLEGIPLALELAAARSLVLSPPQILEKLEGQLDFLETRQKGVPERHRTLRGAIEWSYSLLSPALQSFFARLSVFHGGWTIEAAEIVCEETDALESLTRLRECSLVEAEESGETLRFKMLETLREYAASQVKPVEAFELSQRHFNYFLALAEGCSEEVARGQSSERLEAESDNLRAALEWCLSDDADLQRAEMGARLVVALRPLWNLRSRYAEATSWSEKVLRREEIPAVLRARVISGLGDFDWHVGNFQGAMSRLEKGLEMFREIKDTFGIADTLRSMGRVLVVSGGAERARACFQESLALSRAVGDKRSILLSLVNLCWVILNAPSPLSQMATFEEALALAREMDDRSSTATLMTVLGLIFYAEERYDDAHSHFQEGHDLCVSLGQRWERIINLYGLGCVARERGEFSRSRALLCEAVQQYVSLNAKWELSIQLNALAFLAQREGQPEHAATLLGAAEHIREVVGHHLLGSQVAEYERYLSELRASLDTHTLEVAWARGRLMAQERVVALALQGQ